MRLSILTAPLAAMIALLPAGSTAKAEESPAIRRSVIAAYNFERREDRDFDGFPDGWTRKRDSRHPPYLPIRITAHDKSALAAMRTVDRQSLRPWEKLRLLYEDLPALPPSAVDLFVDHYLRMELDGGAAMAQSPSIPLDPSYRYQLSGQVMTEKLVHHHALIELAFLDAVGNVVTTHRSRPLSGTTHWTAVETELRPPPADATAIAIRLYLVPKHWGSNRDIRGAAGFDDLEIRQIPRVRMETSERTALYRPGDKPVVSMEVMGLRGRRATARFVLRDSDGRSLGSAERLFSFGVKSPSKEGKPAADGRSPGLPTEETEDPEDVFEAIATWTLPPLSPGYYTVSADLVEQDEEWLKTETALAVLGELPAVSERGPFGWSLPSGAKELDYKRLPEWLQQSGVHALKYPLWLDPHDRAGMDAAAWLAERFRESEIRCIGILAAPPPSVQAILDEREPREPVAANLFRDTKVWQPLIEPIMTRLAVRVQTWQVGFDGDHSFLGRPQLPGVLQTLRRDLQGYGPPIGLALAWPWLDTLPPSVAGAVAAASRTAEEPLTPDELDAFLAMQEAPAGSKRAETWVSLDPISRTTYDRDSRIRDLMLRMATVRGHRVAAAFVSDPRHPDHGLLRKDWRPDELLLPWRTTSLVLGDVTRVGRLRLRSDAENQVFVNSKRTVVMLWSAGETEETIYLGDRVRHVDAWGRVSVPERIEAEPHVMHRFPIGPVPSFIVNADPLVVALRMATQLEDDRIDSLLGRRQEIRMKVANPTAELLSGSIQLAPPADWLVESPPQSFTINPGGEASVGFEVILTNSARIGEVDLDFDIRLRTEPEIRFMLTRPIHIGPSGLELEVMTKAVGDELLVYLNMRNHSNQTLQYDCLLFPPEGRQYQRQQINLPAGAVVRREFLWEDASSLIGKSMLLRAVEQGGGRILNHSITVTP